MQEIEGNNQDLHTKIEEHYQKLHEPAQQPKKVDVMKASQVLNEILDKFQP